MRFRLGPWSLAVAVVAVCAGIAFWVWQIRAAPIPVAELAGRMPSAVSTLISIDVAALRSAGILDLIAGSPALEERDYKSFVDVTGFDYRNDLDHLLIGFRGEVTYVLVSGRYDWDALRDYAGQEGGVCVYSFCRMISGAANHNLSFFPVRRDVLGLATGPSEWAASDLQVARGSAIPREWIDQPVMISVSGDALSNTTRMPEAIRPWFQLLDGAELLVLTIGGNNGQWEMQMSVRCSKTDAPPRIQSRLIEATNQLKALVAQEGKEADERTLPGMLAAGTFQVSSNEVRGRWPVRREFLEALAGGKI